MPNIADIPAFSPALTVGFSSGDNPVGLIPALTMLLYCVVLGLLVAISLADAKTMEIPNWLCIALLACGVVAAFIIPEVTLVSRFIGLVCVSVPLLIISLIAPGSFGGGDVKLMAAAGLLLGWQNTLLAACIGILIGAAYGIYLLAAKKKGAKEHFPFAPALCTGIACALLFGSQLIGWYLGAL